jgi:hypothetical protein
MTVVGNFYGLTGLGCQNGQRMLDQSFYSIIFQQVSDI